MKNWSSQKSLKTSNGCWIIDRIYVGKGKKQIISSNKNKPEMHRGVCSKENLSLAWIYFSVYPAHHSLHGAVICIFYAHFHLYFCPYLEVTTPEKKKNILKLLILLPGGKSRQRKLNKFKTSIMIKGMSLRNALFLLILPNNFPFPSCWF